MGQASSKWSANKGIADSVINRLTTTVGFSQPIQYILINQCIECLLDQKYLIMQLLLIRTKFDYFYVDDFERIREMTLKQSCKSRGFQ